ncbi:hypothetical protein ACWDCX_34055, partial [Streptomyces fungicidicus]
MAVSPEGRAGAASRCGRGRHFRVPTPQADAASGRRERRLAGRPARVQLKADTGLGRGGCQPGDDWTEL